MAEARAPEPTSAAPASVAAASEALSGERKLSLALMTGRIAKRWKRRALPAKAVEKIAAAAKHARRAAARHSPRVQPGSPRFGMQAVAVPVGDAEAAAGASAPAAASASAEASAEGTEAPSTPPAPMQRTASFQRKASSRGRAVLLKRQSTMELFTDEEQQFTPARVRLHDKIVARFLRGVPRAEKPRLLLLQGAPGSGKNTILPRLDGYNLQYPRQYVECNTDDAMAALPEYWDYIVSGAHKEESPLLSDPSSLPGSRAERDWVRLFRDEAKVVTSLAATRARESGKSLVWNGTGKKLNKYRGLASDFRSAGYRVSLACVFVEVEEAMRRVGKRAEAYGRSVPASLVRSTVEIIPANFLALAGEVDEAYLYSSMTDPASLVWRQCDGQAELLDPAFLEAHPEFAGVLDLLPCSADQAAGSPSATPAVSSDNVLAGVDVTNVASETEDDEPGTDD